MKDYISSAVALASTNTPGVEQLRPTAGSGTSPAAAILEKMYSVKRGVYVNEATGRVFLEPNTSVKHYKLLLRTIARIPDSGIAKSTFRQWLTKLSDTDFQAALSRVFECFVREDRNLLLAIRPGHSMGTQTAFQAIMAAPDEGVSLHQVASSIVNVTGRAVSNEQLAAYFDELAVWHVVLGDEPSLPPSSPTFLPRSVAFCDWTSMMRGIAARMPPEGVLFKVFLRYVSAEGPWPASAPPNLAAFVTPKWVRQHFGHLLHVRMSRTDGATVIVSPRLGVDTPGIAGDVNCALLADPTTGAAPSLPWCAGWCDGEAAFAVLEAAKPVRGSVGCESWSDFCSAHPAFEQTTLVEVRPKALVSRIAVIIDGTVASPTQADQWLASAGVMHSGCAEKMRIVLRTARQPMHTPDDVVSPAWLDADAVVAAQVAKLRDVDHVVLVTSDGNVASLQQVLSDSAAEAISEVTVVTESHAHRVRSP